VAYTRRSGGRLEGGNNATELNNLEGDKGEGKRFCTALTHKSLGDRYREGSLFERLLVPPVTVAEEESRIIGSLVSSDCLHGSGLSSFVGYG